MTGIKNVYPFQRAAGRCDAVWGYGDNSSPSIGLKVRGRLGADGFSRYREAHCQMRAEVYGVSRSRTRVVTRVGMLVS